MRSAAILPLLVSYLTAQTPPGVVIDHEPASTRRYIGSPSIEVLPNGSYVASHDFFGPASNQNKSSTTRTFRSDDRGRTWRRTAEFQDQFWSNLFFHRGALYLLGTTYEYGRIVIRKSTDGALTWSQPSYLTDDAGYHTAPVTMIKRKGKLWRSFEFHPEGKWGFFEAFVMNASEKADLMDPKSWTKLPRLKFPKGEIEGDHWLEGNLVEDRRGRLVNMLRVDLLNGLERAAVTVVDEKSSSLKFDKSIPLPGAAKKFQIRWDKKSKLYWCLSNPAPAGTEKPASIRNHLLLLSSPDLETWTIWQTILQHPDPIHHAFQYVDWRFDGNDIIVASRTAFDDADGGAHRAHDANYMTFHRIENFRRLAANAQAANPADHPELAQLYQADQQDREASPAKMDWQNVAPRDAARRQRVRALISEGAVRTGKDFERAAMVFQHGDTPDDILYAHVLAVTAIAKGNLNARWLAAASLDRYLHRLNQPQIFGTQFTNQDPSNNETWTMAAYNRDLLAPSLLEANCVPPREHQEEMLKAVRAGTEPPPPRKKPCPAAR
jgi:hypothetical protein